MNISTLARRAGISASGVRWYESAGILPQAARAENGYRQVKPPGRVQDRPQQILDHVSIGRFNLVMNHAMTLAGDT